MVHCRRFLLTAMGAQEFLSEFLASRCKPSVDDFCDILLSGVWFLFNVVERQVSFDISEYRFTPMVFSR